MYLDDFRKWAADNGVPTSTLVILEARSGKCSSSSAMSLSPQALFISWYATQFFLVRGGRSAKSSNCLKGASAKITALDLPGYLARNSHSSDSRCEDRNY